MFILHKIKTGHFNDVQTKNYTIEYDWHCKKLHEDWFQNYTISGKMTIFYFKLLNLRKLNKKVDSSKETQRH